MWTWSRRQLGAALLLLGVGGSAWALTPGQVACEQLGVGGFEAPQATQAEAARFLTQATFGPCQGEAMRLRELGYERWITEQLAMPATLTRPWLDSLVTNPSFSLNSGHRVDRWHAQAVYAPDQLRQRMAFALSQIMVIADSGGINDRMVAEYQDLLARNAFGTYRNLLQEVSLSPTMGQWLTWVRNRAAYASGGSTILPDENYAREVMQLFSFGLVKLNLNGTVQTDGQGNPLPTYNNAIIAELARVFTGVTYANSTNFTNSTGANFMAPMVCWPINAQGQTFHDNAAKTIFDSITLPAVPNTVAGCTADLNAALDAIANHGSVAPFMARRLIQRFVTSNPSPAYIQRVATVFNNNGSGVRGDLGAVVRAILLDPEARAAPSGDFGKLREPQLRMTALWRALNTVAGQLEPPTNANGTTNTNVGNLSMSIGFVNSDFGQRPLSSPTVFNFFEPDYQAPGPIANQDLYSPEFQILTESTITRMNNTIRNRGIDWFVGMTNPQPTWPLVQLDDLSAIVTPANATTHAALVDEINQRLMYGSMSTGMRSTLITMLNGLAAGTSARDRVRNALYVTLFSPEFAVQK